MIPVPIHKEVYADKFYYLHHLFPIIINYYSTVLCTSTNAHL